MQTKYEWRKQEKALYIPKAKPAVIDIPAFNFITIDGEGSPAEAAFSDCVGALYAVAYTIKMMLKKISSPPTGYCDYTVYPLEGIWDINDAAKANFNGVINKQDLVYKLMIRQPDFVGEALYNAMLQITKDKKNNPLLDTLNFEQTAEGRCIQMLHLGPFDDEPASFAKMEDFARAQGLQRESKAHREIYLSDPRKVEPEKLKTVLRFKATAG